MNASLIYFLRLTPIQRGSAIVPRASRSAQYAIAGPKNKKVRLPAWRLGGQSMIPSLVYALCAVTSIVCATLLLRSSQKLAMPLLFWSGASFAALAIGNVLLFVDLAVVKDRDLLLLQNCITLAGISMLLYGLIWETK